jgi:DNA polymerase V
VLKAMLSLSKHLQNQKKRNSKEFLFLHQVADDEINARCGQQKIRLATQAHGRVWRMNQERLSPRYTTNLNEIMTLNCL